MDDNPYGEPGYCVFRKFVILLSCYRYILIINMLKYLIGLVYSAIVLLIEKYVFAF